MKLFLLICMTLLVTATQEEAIGITPEELCNGCQMTIPYIAQSYLEVYEQAYRHGQKQGADQGKPMEIQIPNHSVADMQSLFCSAFHTKYDRGVEYGCAMFFKQKFTELREILDSRLSYDKLNAGKVGNMMMKKLCGSIPKCKPDVLLTKKQYGTEKCAMCTTVTEELAKQLSFHPQLKSKFLENTVTGLKNFCDLLRHKYDNKRLLFSDMCEAVMEEIQPDLLTRYLGFKPKTHNEKYGAAPSDQHKREVDFSFVYKHCKKTKRCKVQKQKERDFVETTDGAPQMNMDLSDPEVYKALMGDEQAPKKEL